MTEQFPGSCQGRRPEPTTEKPKIEIPSSLSSIPRMSLNEYQKATEETAIYPAKGELGGLLYTTIGLAGEMGEFANVVKKLLRDGLSDEKINKLVDELGDTLWYVARCACELGVTLEDVANINLAKLAKRKAENKIHGSDQADGSRR